MKKYNIKEFAKLCAVTPRTLKYYEEIGLFHPASVSQSGYREYTQAQIDEVSAIALFAEHGMKLKEIKEMFAQENLQDVCIRMQQQKQLVDQKIRLLKDQQCHLEIMLWHIEHAKNKLNKPFLVTNFKRQIRIEEIEEENVHGKIINYLLTGFLNGAILEKNGAEFQLKRLYFHDKDGIAYTGMAAFLYTENSPEKSVDDLNKLQSFASTKGLNGNEIYCEQILESNGVMKNLFLYFIPFIV